jgi:hypothetical protein
MAPRNLSKKQAEHAVAGEDFESEQETLDPKAISKDMEKNVSTVRIELDINQGYLTQDFNDHTLCRRTLARPRSAAN